MKTEQKIGRRENSAMWNLRKNSGVATERALSCWRVLHPHLEYEHYKDKRKRRILIRYSI
jgi:hypothetical protein